MSNFRLDVPRNSTVTRLKTPEEEYLLRMATAAFRQRLAKRKSFARPPKAPRPRWGDISRSVELMLRSRHPGSGLQSSVEVYWRLTPEEGHALCIFPPCTDQKDRTMSNFRLDVPRNSTVTRLQTPEEEYLLRMATMACRQ